MRCGGQLMNKSVFLPRKSVVSIHRTEGLLVMNLKQEPRNMHATAGDSPGCAARK